MAKPHTLEKLFEKGNFRQFAPYFFDKPITSTAAEELCGISRTTIDEVIITYLRTKTVNKTYKYKYVAWDFGKKGHPFRLKMDILSDYLYIKMGLNKPETELLLKIINNQNIKPVIVRENKTMDTILSKIILIILLLDIVSFQLEKVQRPKDLEKLFLAYGLFDVLRNRLIHKVEETNSDLVQTQTLTESDIEVHSNIFRVTNLELENFSIAFQKFANKNTDNLRQLCEKFRNSDFTIITYPKNWYEMLLTVTEPMVWYQIRFKRKFKRELKHIIAQEGK